MKRLTLIVLPALVIMAFGPAGSLFASASGASAASLGSSSQTVNLDQCANLTIPCDWQNGDLNGNNSAYAEGDVVPFRLAIEGLSAGEHSIHINYDFTAGGHEAYDFLATYNATEKVDLCAPGGGAVSSLCPSLPAPDVKSFPADPFVVSGTLGGLSVAGAEAASGVGRKLTMFGGTIVSITPSSGPMHSGSTAGDSSADFVVTFRASGSDVLFAWGGHIASSAYWINTDGTPDGASQISGASWHMRTQNLDDSGNKNQDRSIQPSALAASTPTPTSTASSTPTSTSTGTATATPTGGSTSTPTGTATSTATSTPIGTATSTATSTPTGTLTSTPTGTATSTGTPTGTGTPAPTGTPTPTGTPGSGGLGGSICPAVPSAPLGTDLAVGIAGNLQGNSTVPAGTTATLTYPGVQTGPVQVVSTNGKPVIASQRAFYGPYSTFDEVMGVPGGQLTTDYWFPWYDMTSMVTWLVVGNPQSTAAHVTIKIAGTTVAAETVNPCTTAPNVFPGVISGPVEVLSDLPVVTSERAVVGHPGGAESFNEVMGYPASQLSTDYWFSSFDGKNMITWLLLGNPSSTTTAHVTVRLAGSVLGTFSVPPSSSIYPLFPGVVGSPMEVTSDINIVTSQRSYTGPSSSWTFNEVPGVPNSRLTTDYWFPWYDDVKTSTSILIVNTSSTSTAHATIKIAGTVAGTYTINPGSTASPSFAGVQNGPVEVTSDIPVFTSEKSLGGSPNAVGSLNELLGLPASELDVIYWLPWYDQLTMTTDLMVGRP